MIHIPGFRGIVASSEQRRDCRSPDWAEGESLIWTIEGSALSVRVSGQHLGGICAWHRPTDRRNRASVLAFGSFYLAGDSSFDDETNVEKLPIEVVPDAVATLYDERGPGAFARFDGDFSLILWDPSSVSLFLLADKFGCNDLYIRKEDDSIFFASQPESLLDQSTPFDSLAVAFLVAQEGFLPAPFTLSSAVKSIGRARFLRITRGRQGLETATKRYWYPGENRPVRPSSASSGSFGSLLKNAVESRLTDNSAVLLSGGIDSSLLFNFAVPRRKRVLIALTGAIRGHSDAEAEIESARSLSDNFGVPHEAIILDPDDDALPDEATECANSWMSGMRLALPLWRRYAQRLESRLGTGYSVLSGQTADTLADNNYTLPSAGYTLRRLFFSSLFLQCTPLLRRLAPAKGRPAGRWLSQGIQFAAGTRIARMFESLLDGMTDRERFYSGRLFGYGEFPGLAPDYFPMLSAEGFARVTDWYCTACVRSLVQRLEPSSFYREMIELSMDMVMLHLDSRLLFHIYRLEGGRAQLPFMDARIVNFFAQLPYGARAIWREPKHVIRSEMRRKGMTSPPATKPPSRPSTKSQEELLLGGSMGRLFRELLAGPTFVNRVPGLFELLDEDYFESQIESFRKGEPGVNFKFVAKVGTLEMWSQALAERKTNALQHAIA
jgi:hypothetical protein